MSLYALVRVDDPATNYKLAQTGLHGRTLAITPEDIAMLREIADESEKNEGELDYYAQQFVSVYDYAALRSLASKLEALLS